MLKDSIVRVRFAPSPTGHLHVGGARMAIFNWLFARASGGQFLLRIEDTDKARSTIEYQKSIINSLAWLGIESDEKIVIQSENEDFHFQVAQDFVNKKLAYKCFCSREEMDALRENSEDSSFRYPGNCRDLSDEVIHSFEKKPFVIRFSLPKLPEKVFFDDVIKGRIEIDSAILDDFVIVKNDGVPTYNFAVVLDDLAMRITHVLRGEEHIVNTFRQNLLYEALGKSLPIFGHTPMILGSNGEKLSKRHGATSVEEYKIEGYLPEAMLNYLVKLGWSCKDQEIFSKEDLFKLFSLDGIGTKNGIFDPEKLKWLNTVYLKQLSFPKFLSRLAIINLGHQKFLSDAKRFDVAAKLFSLFVVRAVTLIELSTALVEVFNFVENFSRANAMFLEPEVRNFLKEFLSESVDNNYASAVDFQNHAKSFINKKGIKLVELAKPLRFVFMGNYEGPSAFDLMAIFGSSYFKKVIKDL